MFDYPFFAYNQDFVLFGNQHILVMGLMVVLCIILPLAARSWGYSRKLTVSRIIAVSLAVSAIAYPVIRALLGDFDKTTDLPLDLCNISAFLMPIIMWTPKKKYHGVLYFLVLAGTLQAVLTPHLYNGWPNFTFIKYWVIHAGLIVYVVYITVAFKFYPDWKSLIKAFVALQVYAIILYGINSLLESNYFYIMEKPPTGSALDYLGPWPWYILVCEGLVLVLFAIVLFPVRLFVGKQKA
ncbi:MAG: TIGR02206 family membrane protein [Bacteroidota bacterium]